MPKRLQAKTGLWPVFGGLLLLGGCSSVITQGSGAGAGVGAAAIANAVHANGAITAGIGLGTQAAAIAAAQYWEQQVHETEQNAIAGAAGNVPVGGVSTWSISHRVPIEPDQHGEVTVTRYIIPTLPAGDAPGFVCKEIIFSVDTVQHRQPDRDFYTADVCRDGAVWKWATAEPATERWGALQ